MRELRTFQDVTVEYYRNHPEEIDDFLRVTFEEYSTDHDIEALVSALRIVCRAKGISLSTEPASSVQNEAYALQNGESSFEQIHVLLQALGYQLIPEPLAARV